MVDVFARRRALILGELEKLEHAAFVTPSGAFYVMLCIGGVYGKSLGERKISNSVDFASALLDEEKVAVVPGVSFGADDCVRLSYSLSEEEIVEGVARIGAFLKKLR
jgi:aspartate aminotransferase